MNGNPIAVWQCPNCQRVQTLTFYGGISTCTINKWCTCYGVTPSNGQSIELRAVFQMQPLNELARRVDMCDAQREAERVSVRERLKEMLAAWPPAPCDRFTWEARN